MLSKEILYHFSCESCKKWWTIGDAETSSTYFCPWCRVIQRLEETNNMDIEKEALEKGLTAPRVTKDSIEAKIQKTEFYIWPNTNLTICLLTLHNGFTVIGESACASPKNFNKELGERIALENAFNKLWQLEGYLLREQLYQVS